MKRYIRNPENIPPQNHSTSVAKLTIETIAGPGQKPLTPQPMPNNIAPKHSDRSMVVLVGKE